MLMEDDFFCFFLFLSARPTYVKVLMSLDVIWGDMMIALLYTVFSYISTVFLMFTSCLIMSSPDFLLFLFVFLCLIMLRHLWWRGSSHFPSDWLLFSSCFILSIIVFLPVLLLIMFLYVLPCYPPVDYVSPLFPQRYPDEDRDDFMICLIWWLFKTVC